MDMKIKMVDVPDRQNGGQNSRKHENQKGRCPERSKRLMSMKINRKAFFLHTSPTNAKGTRRLVVSNMQVHNLGLKACLSEVRPSQT
jgi:hypothetical protein